MKTIPLSYRSKILSLPGVEQISAAVWFGGVYKEPENFFSRIAVEVEPFLEMYPEYRLTPKEKSDFLREKGSCIVGEGTAKAYGMALGQTVQLRGDIFPGAWDFTIRGIYTTDQEGVDNTQMFFHWSALNERIKAQIAEMTDFVGWYWVKIADPGKAAEISRQIDDNFENSSAQTRTETEEAFLLGFISMMGNIQFLLTVIGIAVFAAMTMVAMNTMMMSARERTNEIGVLKSIGFTGTSITGLILAEALWISGMGYVLGTVGSLGLESALRPLLSAVAPTFYIPFRARALGFGIALLIGLASGLLPAIRASRLKPVDALRTVQ